MRKNLSATTEVSKINKDTKELTILDTKQYLNQTDVILETKFYYNNTDIIMIVDLFLLMISADELS